MVSQLLPLLQHVTGHLDVYKRQELSGAGMVETLVDNEIAVQNLTKMAQQKNYGVRSEKLGENQYRVIMTIGESADEAGEMCIRDRCKRHKNLLPSIDMLKFDSCNIDHYSCLLYTSRCV